MGPRNKLDVGGLSSSNSNGCVHWEWIFLPCSARRGPGAVVPKKVALQQDNGKSEIGKNWNEYPGRKEDNFVERSAKIPTLGSSFLAAPSMQMHWLVPRMEPESQCELSGLAEGCQVLAFHSCSLLWLIATAGGLLRGEAKTDR